MSDSLASVIPPENNRVQVGGLHYLHQADDVITEKVAVLEVLHNERASLRPRRWRLHAVDYMVAESQ